MNKTILEYIVRLKDKTKAGWSSAAKNAKAFIGNIVTVRAAIVAATATVGALAYALKKAFEMERYNTQFKVLLGSLEQAKIHMRGLAEFSDRTPFELPEIADASRKLIVFTNGVLGGQESLELIGDAAAATGSKINDLSFWIGRAYSSISAGAPFGEAGMRLQEMGILSGAARKQMDDLSKSGASNAEIWAVLQRELEKSKGGMKDLSQTGEGLMSTLRQSWSNVVAEFGEAFTDAAKDGIGTLIEYIKRLKEDGSIVTWAENTVAVIGKIVTAAEKLKTLGQMGQSSVLNAFTLPTKIGKQSWTQLKEDASTVFDWFKGKAKSIIPDSMKDIIAGALQKMKGRSKIGLDFIPLYGATEKGRSGVTRTWEEGGGGLGANIARDMAEQQAAVDKLKRLAEMQAMQGSNLALAKSESAKAWAAYLSPEEFARQQQEKRFERESKERFAKESDWIGRQAEAYGVDYLRTQGERWRSGMSQKDQAIYDVVKARMEEQAAERALVDIERNTRETKQLLKDNLTRE